MDFAGPSRAMIYHRRAHLGGQAASRSVLGSVSVVNAFGELGAATTEILLLLLL